MITDKLLIPNDYEKVFPFSNKIIKIKKINDYDKIVVDKNTLLIQSSKMIDELLKSNKADYNMIMKFLFEDIHESIIRQNYNLKKIFYHLTNNSFEFNHIDLIYFKNIILDTRKDNILKEKFIDFLYSVLCNNKNENKEYIKSMLYITITNYDMNREIYKSLFNNPNIIKTLFFIKFKTLPLLDTELDTINEEQMLYINTKAINVIASNIDSNSVINESNIYVLAIKMYLTFGLELSLKILNNEYGQLDKLFFSNLNKLDNTNIKFKKEGKKYIPIINKGFINFMFTNKINNNFSNMIHTNNYLKENWSYLYNNFYKIKEKCRNKLTIKKVNIILKQTSPNRNVDNR